MGHNRCEKFHYLDDQSQISFWLFSWRLLYFNSALCYVEIWLPTVSGAPGFFEHMRKRGLPLKLVQNMKEKLFPKPPGNCYTHWPQLGHAHSQSMTGNGIMLINLDLNCANSLRLESHISEGSQGRDVTLKNRRCLLTRSGYWGSYHRVCASGSWFSPWYLGNPHPQATIGFPARHFPL